MQIRHAVRVLLLKGVLMQKKVFWVLFTVLGAIASLTLPIYWNLALTLPLLVGCWWVVYRSGWFE